MTGLAGVSVWALSLLPRLFLYPGGVWMLAALLWLRLASGGPQVIRPATLGRGLVEASLPALAVAWAALALTPLPGAAPLAAPIDRLALVALVLVSLTLDWKEGAWGEGWIGAGMALAVLSPLARGRSLLEEAIGWETSGVLSILCVAAGLAALSASEASGLSGNVRWLAWLGLGFAPLWTGWAQPPVPGVYWVSLVYALGIAGLAGVGKLVHVRFNGRETYSAIVVWGLAILSLLAALLGH